jgi:hypothetical protein
LAQYIQKIRNEGFPDYTVKPAGDREARTPIVYVETVKRIRLRVVDEDPSADKSLLYDSQPGGKMADASSWTLEGSIITAIENQCWSLRFTQAAERLHFGLVYGILFGGTIISLLLFGLLLSNYQGDNLLD